MKWLKGVLAEKDLVAKTQLLEDADANNITKATLRRAYDALDCRSVNDTFQGKWYWYLPELVAKKAKEDAEALEATANETAVECEKA